MAITRALFAGDDPTPDSVKKRMALAELLRQQGDDISHIDSPLEAIGSILQSGAAVYNDRKAQSDQKAGMSSRNAALASLLTGSGGSSSAMMGGGGAAIGGGMGGMGGGVDLGGGAIAPSGATANLKPADREGYVMSYLTSKGLAPHQAAGFTGNLIQESSLNTGAKNPGDGRDGSDSIGIGQWNGDRARNLRAFAKGTGRDVGDIDTQLDFALHEMGLGNAELRNLPGWGAEGRAGQALKSAQDVQSAAAAGISFERPSGWSQANPTAGHGWDNRFGHAQRLAGMNWSGQQVASASPAPATQQPVQVASLDPSAGMGAATSSAAPAAAPQPAPSQQAAQAPVQPAQNPQLAQMLIGGGGGAPPQTQASGVSDATIAELLGNPWTEDIGQGLLQQKLQDNAANARLTRQYQIDQAKTADERQYDRAKVIDQRQYDQMTEAQKRAYDDQVRQQGYAREDSRNNYLDARQGNRDARSDLESDRNFDRAVRADQKPPTSVQEYEYARQNGFTGSFSDWETQNRRASANSVSVNTGEGDKFYENLDRKNAERFATLSDGGQDARSRIAQLDQLGTLLQQSPSGAEARIKMLLGDFGVNTEGLDSLQATTALIERMVPAQREPGSGPMSDADIAGFRRSLPRVINQPGGNELILGTTKAIAEYDIQRGEIADMVADRAITPAEGRKRLRELQNPLTGYSDLIRNLGTGGDGPRVSQTPRIDGVPVGAATSPAQPSQPSSKAEYDALPSGAMFRAPDGSVRRKR